MAAVALSPTRALHRPRHLDWRALFGFLLLLVATGGSIVFWSASSDARPVLVALRDLPAGATLRAADLAVAHVRLDDAMYAAAIPADELGNLAGKQLTEPIHAQQLLVQAQLSSRPVLGPGELALAVPIAPETAVGGRVRAGDEVQVLLTINQGKPEAATTVVLSRATVYDVGYDQRVTVVNTDLAGQSSQGPAKWLTLIVTPQQALALTQARWAGQLDVALLPPESR